MSNLKVMISCFYMFLPCWFTAISTSTFGTSKPVRVCVESSMPRALPKQVATLLMCPEEFYAGSFAASNTCVSRGCRLRMFFIRHSDIQNCCFHLSIRIRQVETTAFLIHRAIHDANPECLGGCTTMTPGITHGWGR